MVRNSPADADTSQASHSPRGERSMKKTKKSRPTDSRLERALDEVMKALSADSGTIHVKDPVVATLHLGASRNVPDTILDVVREVPWGKGMAGVAAQRAAPVTF